MALTIMRASGRRNETLLEPPGPDWRPLMEKLNSLQVTLHLLLVPFSSSSSAVLLGPIAFLFSTSLAAAPPDEGAQASSAASVSSQISPYLSLNFYPQSSSGFNHLNLPSCPVS